MRVRAGSLTGSAEPCDTDACATAAGAGAGLGGVAAATGTEPAPGSAKPRSSRLPISRSRERQLRPPMTTPISRLPLRTADAARLNPESLMKPVFMPSAPEYQDEWHSFVTVLDAHASEEERDLCPAPIDLSKETLDALGNLMLERIARLRRSTVHKLRVRGRKALLSSL